MKTVRSFLWFLIISLLFFSVIAPVSANPPLVWTFHEELVDFTRDDIVCNGVALVQTSVFDMRVTTFFDKDGNPRRATYKISIQGIQGAPTLVNPVNGKSWTHSFHYTDFVDLSDGTTKTVGLVQHLNVPGKGTIALDAGNLQIDATGNIIFVAGPHPLWYLSDGYNDWEALVEIVCSYLG